MSTTSHFAGSKSSFPTIALTGFMGSGKTSTGQALAEFLGWEFIDLDEEIERQERVPIRELFRTRGETAFRAIEHEALRRSLVGRARPIVLALGGGAFMQRDNVELLNAHEVRTVFLETPVDEVLTRCGVEDELDPENPRPLAADSAAFRKLYEQRLPSYRTAHLTIDTTGKSVEQVASEISDSLKLIAGG